MTSPGARGRGDAPGSDDDSGSVDGPPGWLTTLAATVVSGELMAPVEGWPQAPGHARPAAVLILFGPGEGERGPDVLLLERAAALRKHAGQPAFPGGGADPADRRAADTALREAAEEVGLDPAGVEVLGTAPPIYVPASNYLVTPVLGWWRVPCPVYPVDPGETSTVVRVPVADLVDPANRVRLRHPRSGQPSPAFRVAGLTTVWGFTAGVLDALLRLAGLELPWGQGPPVDDPAVNASIARAMAQLAEAGKAEAVGEIDPDEIGAPGLATTGTGVPGQGGGRADGAAETHQASAPDTRDRTAGTGTGAGPTKGTAA